MEAEVTARVVRVELFEDRVAVTRLVTLEQADAQLVVGPLSPLIRTGGLLVEGSSPDVLVEDVSIQRKRVQQEVADGESIGVLRQAASEAEAERDRCRRSLTVAEAADDAAQARWEAAEGWTGRAYSESASPDAWIQSTRGLYADWTAAQAAVLDAQFALQLAEQRHQLAERRLYDARAGTSVLRTMASLRVHGTPGDTLELRYTIPCAAWRPVHRARMEDGTLTWELAAMVWNATGEDWSGAEVICSTARPGQRATPPVLVDDVVRAVKRGRDVVVEEREEAVTVAREGEARTVQSVPGVDDGGEVRTFTASDPPDLPSNASPVRVPLDSWSVPAETWWMAAPELSEALVRVSRQTNGGTRPLLAGPVELVGSSGVVGRGRVELVPPGEPFLLGWGAHDDVRVRRTAETTRSDGRLSGRSQTAVSVRVLASNTSGNVVQARIRERVPVSELEAVTVSRATAQPVLAEGPDADGFCEWHIAIQPHESHELALNYTVDAASHVTLSL